MISHKLLRDEGILIVTPEEPLTASDFNEVAQEVDPFIAAKDGLTGLVIQAESFPGWEDFGALISHLKFIRDHHQKIRKVAAITDARFLSIMPRVVNHFVNAEVKHFKQSEGQAAFDWIREA
jgi:hypothetical protein